MGKALQGGLCFAGVTSPSLSSSILRTIKLVFIQTFAVHVYLLIMIKDGMALKQLESTESVDSEWE